MSKGIVQGALDNPIQLAIGIGIIGAVVYFFGRKIIGDVGGLARDVVSGDNALTQGTPYQNTGVVGTVAAAANEASGGALQSIGESLGGWLYNVTHTEYDPNSGLQTGSKTVQDGARATDRLWGPIGSISLRAQ